MNLKLVVVLLCFLCISQAYPRNHRRQDWESADEDLEKQIEEEFEELLKDEGRLRKGGKENQSGGGRGEGRIGNKGRKRPSSTAEPDQNDRPARPKKNGEGPKPSDMPVMSENRRRAYEESVDEDLEEEIEEEIEDFLKGKGSSRKGDKKDKLGGGKDKDSCKERVGNKRPKRPSSTAEPDQNDRPARPETNGEGPKPSDMPIMPENRRRAYEESVDEDLEKEIEEIEDFLKGKGSSRKGGNKDKLGGGKDKDSGKGRMGNKRPKRPSSTAEPDQNDRPARPETNGEGPKPSDMPVMPENRRRAYEESVDEDLEKEIEEEIEDFLKGKGSSRKGGKKDKLVGGKDKDSGKGRMGNKRPKRPRSTAEPHQSDEPARPDTSGEGPEAPED